jgi:hypothetical protein
MIGSQLEPSGPTVPTSHSVSIRSGSPSDRNPDQPQDSANAPAAGAGSDPILCRHCGRTASNGISCEGICVADSGY